MASEAQAALRTANPTDPSPLLSEVHMLREVLGDAVRALSRRGVTPAAYAALPEPERGQEVWREAVRVWKAAGIAPLPARRVVLRCSDGGPGEEHVFASAQVALEAAIAAIEANESYPEAIVVDGRCIMDRASILRAWEDRHDPG